MKKFINVCFMVMFTMLVLAGCKGESVKDNAVEENTSIILSTTTSTENSGLLDAILPVFKEQTNIDVKVVAVGTGKALQMGRDGEADVLLVHAKPSEETFVSENHGVERFDVMYNDFVIVGPESDPAGLKEYASNVVEALKKLNSSGEKFISRGDDSGTHKKEKSLWASAEITPEGDNYISAGKGMGDVIQMTDEMQGYTMSDRATFLSMSDKIDLKVIVEGDEILFNQYGVIAVNPEKNDKINSKGADEFIKWLLSEETQKLISEFGVEKFGQPLFVPNAK
ncbi:MAG: substrate-binding domain-containing protein [Tissierellales bacterium]|nr:substrate-binding domain-containing protein [Tissierellales bacterium]